MKRKFIGYIVGMIVSTTPVFAQETEVNELCVDYFGVGALVEETCRPLSGPKRKIGPSELNSALSDGVANLRIVSDDNPEEPYDLAPLSSAGSVHSLELFRVGPVDLTPLQDMKGLLRLDLSADAAVALDQLTTELPELAELRIYAPRRTIDLGALSNMPALRVLYVKAAAITGQQNLSDLTRLERATFELAENTEFSSLAELDQLKWLEISGTLGRTVLHDIEFVAPLRSLTHLDLSTNDIEDLRPLSGLEDLKLLILSYNKELSDISPLSSLTGLTVLQLRDTQVSDLGALRNMSKLGVLWLDRTPVSDISALAGLKSLSGLELSRTQVTDIAPLSQLPLRHLSLRGTDVTDFSAVPAGVKLKK